MTLLHETIRVKRPAAEAFAYVADFTTTAEWDSTAREATKLTAGPVAVGTRFLVNCAMPLGTIDIEYEVAELDPPRKILLRGSSRFFDIEDTITFTGSGNSTRIDYQAQFHFRPLIKPLTGAMEPGLQRMGKASLRGLKEALDDRFPAPREPDDALADRLVLPKLARFTRVGYRRGRKHWHPVSADLRGKHVVITGSSTGLGFASAMELARRGADLTLVMRNKGKAEAVRREIQAETGNDNIALELADLSLLADVDALVARLSDQGRPIDVLINNAGALYNEWQATSEGIERSVALLLLSPYRLTLGLKPLLAAADGARVINVVSGGMYSQKLSVKRLVSREDEEFAGATAYARAKRALMVVTRHWARTWRKEGIAVNAMHPGWADTPGVQTSLPTFHTLTRFALRSPEEGADTIVWLAAATEAGKLSGQLLLDREPQTQYLLKGTEETAAERKKLFRFLEAYAPAANATASPLPQAKAS
ncbi:SDR family NAD(P)-dependent oxidoreductase [Seongchinamella sediminis]|uniref:SDR family NAD(P)-dependent oxidoreductase n=1 Tax=Seongchinamella sediminis TaxID=2283635 RepID=A0A3L7DXX0_9GAMM|nr:SDR family NAD(P)-dependent oxidoreductase [Seongchinamella sediminis]RLQ22438.1 SDR family NAD(P)-dependent oxidoreductase [Seongchinamella sediminis]